MEDYTLSELVKADHLELLEQIDLRYQNVAEINQTIENMPESPETPKRIVAAREEMLIIEALKLVASFKKYLP